MAKAVIELPGSEFDLDPNTGLPQLPEGYYFLVEKNAIYVVQSADAVPWRDWRLVEVVRTGRKAKAEHVEKAMEEGRIYFQGNYDPEESQYELRTAHLKTRHHGNPGKKWYIQVWMRTRMDRRVHGLQQVNPSPENLLELTTELLKRWNERKAQDAILGAYPPKKYEAA